MSIQKTKIRHSKKAIFLVVGLIHLNFYLVLAVIFPSLPISIFVNSLIIILSLYLTGESVIDVASRFNYNTNYSENVGPQKSNKNNSGGININVVRPYSQLAKEDNDDNSNE